MIRKQTWILLLIFAVLAGGAYYLQQHPIENSAAITPSPTAQPLMIKDWQSSDITMIAFQDNLGMSLSLGKSGEGKWTLQPGEETVEAGKVNELLAEIFSAKVITSLDTGYDLAVVGLATPSKKLSLTHSSGKQMEIKIGQATPTNNGYYVQVAQDAPVVISKGAIDSIVGLLTRESLLDLTPTPAATTTSVPTETP